MIPINTIIAYKIIAIIGNLAFSDLSYLLVLFVIEEVVGRLVFFLLDGVFSRSLFRFGYFNIVGVVPYSPIVAHINLLGSFIEATFLSLALADRFYLLKLETDRIYERLKKANQQMIQAFGMTVEKKVPSLFLPFFIIIYFVVNSIG